jgi:predicted RNA methylase
MPPRKPQHRDAAQPVPAPMERVVLSESLLATESEKSATSKSLYGDHKARIGSNLGSVTDRARIAAYTAAINACAKGKNVLHIGCGLGLLSMIAARAKAAMVVGVDTSSIVHTATEVAARNKLSNVKFIQGKLHDGTAVSPVPKFDLILCEWMGALLTNDDLLTEVDYCTKNLLAPGGVVCPNRATLHAVALSDYQYRVESLDYWDNVYGFQMHPMRPLVLHEISSGHIPRENVATKPVLAQSYSIDAGVEGGAPLPDRSFTTTFQIVAEKKSTLHFITLYVAASFVNKENPRGNFVLGFSPGGHNSFTEVSIALPEPMPVFANDVVTCELSVKPLRSLFTEVHLKASVNNAAAPNFSTQGKYVFQY